MQGRTRRTIGNGGWTIGNVGQTGRKAGNARVDEASDGHIKLGGHPSDPTLLRSERLDSLPPRECRLVGCLGGRVGPLEDLNF